MCQAQITSPVGDRRRSATTRGIAGSFIAGTLAGLLNIEFTAVLGNLLVATIGPILALWILGSVTSRY
jgi:uncharacterized membrane protein YeaQ/YmgE (transglycosylase-associated protein family)